MNTFLRLLKVAGITLGIFVLPFLVVFILAGYDNLMEFLTESFFFPILFGVGSIYFLFKGIKRWLENSVGYKHALIALVLGGFALLSFGWVIQNSI